MRVVGEGHGSFEKKNEVFEAIEELRNPQHYDPNSSIVIVLDNLDHETE